MRESTIQTIKGPASLRRAVAAEVLDLRHRVLRAGLPRDSARFDGDENATARHVIAVLGNGDVVGCATVHGSTWQGAPAWQLRGMATDPMLQGSGVGRALLLFLENLLVGESAVRQMWCNARVPAVGFYQRMGWGVVSDPFEIPTAGPHVKMTKALDAPKTRL